MMRVDAVCYSLYMEGHMAVNLPRTQAALEALGPLPRLTSGKGTVTEIAMILENLFLQQRVREGVLRNDNKKEE